ncbi:hypothetical protein B0A48_07687 [Cryoendolithus antarcticus]|uniref:Uncharacterized protein n=1 Tax=Cryoendolithus antarcticus TaxID=1507870 RepID=A0A1V8T721_9PEZI|nr:hypothetical protein B0A48_07687 [Cryoendolithus antarcticus]
MTMSVEPEQPTTRTAYYLVQWQEHNATGLSFSKPLGVYKCKSDALQIVRNARNEDGFVLRSHTQPGYPYCNKLGPIFDRNDNFVGTGYQWLYRGLDLVSVWLKRIWAYSDEAETTSDYDRNRPSSPGNTEFGEDYVGVAGEGIEF